MGNCVTVYKNKDVADMDISVRIQSPIKENNVGKEVPIAGYDPRPQNDETSFREKGKAEERFFDSQPWLDSDCEDFFSVNGDSVSSSCNSPNHQKSFRENSIPHQNKSPDHAENAVPAESPTDTKKLLIELFRESFNDDDANNNDTSSKQRLENEPSTSSPYESIPNSARSNGMTPCRGCLPENEKSARSAPRCLPSLVRNMSFGERKKRLSPAQN
ncbi:putative Serine-threonine protein kinase, plant-type [Hibiscus syriacus]|uniref:Serine-threonine protein kinase, plant-type n=1 Tax=Hibiscus syriacus TaxID=106335 RepID=A0A6A3A3Q3_HIBSY|nr:uncharacterized protein At3g27210-like [Hibiscus syriacus]KAE8698921.1 putative Serine-threonine protein kinase, plant-type [Hibiscus syriacus]